MKAAKILIAGLVLSIFNALVGMVTCGGFFSWIYKLQPTEIWKPMGNAPDIIFYVGGFIISVIFVGVYVLINKGLPGQNKFMKGIAYGLGVWAVGMLPGMFVMYSFMRIATEAIIYWTVLGLIQKPIEGMIAAMVYGE
jgi:hypothetical protein